MSAHSVNAFPKYSSFPPLGNFSWIQSTWKSGIWKRFRNKGAGNCLALYKSKRSVMEEKNMPLKRGAVSWPFL